MADNLLPCPFCGGKPEFRRSGRQGHYIACTGCDSSSTMFTALKDDVRDLLVETWNRRVVPSGQTKDEMALLPGHVDGRPYKVIYDDGWVVRASDGSNAYERGWRWNSRSSARAYKHECEYFGHEPISTPAPSQGEEP